MGHRGTAGRGPGPGRDSRQRAGPGRSRRADRPGTTTGRRPSCRDRAGRSLRPGARAPGHGRPGNCPTPADPPRRRAQDRGSRAAAAAGGSCQTRANRPDKGRSGGRPGTTAAACRSLRPDRTAAARHRHTRGTTTPHRPSRPDRTARPAARAPGHGRPGNYPTPADPPRRRAQDRGSRAAAAAGGSCQTRANRPDKGRSGGRPGTTAAACRSLRPDRTAAARHRHTRGTTTPHRPSRPDRTARPAARAPGHGRPGNCPTPADPPVRRWAVGPGGPGLGAARAVGDARRPVIGRHGPELTGHGHVLAGAVVGEAGHRRHRAGGRSGQGAVRRGAGQVTRVGREGGSARATLQCLHHAGQVVDRQPECPGAGTPLPDAENCYAGVGVPAETHAAGAAAHVEENFAEPGQRCCV